ncbi:MAG: hypothetical protein NC321_00290 [Clostridium sp.]|nr:hypothetical protein [Clostridium sp.]
MQETVFEDMLNYPENYMVQGGGEYELVSEMGFLRSIIKYKNYEIVIYGAGLRCEYLLHWLKKERISVKFIIDNDIDKHNKQMDSCTIYHPDRIPLELLGGGYLVLISPKYYETETAEILQILRKLGMDNFIYPFAQQYGLAPYRYSWFHYYTCHKNELLKMFEKLEDTPSREAIFEYIKAIITNCVYKGEHGKSCNKYFEGYIPLKDECFLNVGSCVGDSIFYFIENRKEQFEKIYGVEGDGDTYRKLRKNINILPDDLLHKIELKNIYLDKSSVEYYIDKKITLINMDIEGMEKEVIIGLKECIKKNRPVLAICAYHKPEDIVELPLLVYEIVDKYKIMFRKYAPSYNNRLGNAELVMYAVPREREIV